ncbi:MAG: hypothetical protein V4492_00130 [Chlamydiota bacterium]
MAAALVQTNNDSPVAGFSGGPSALGMLSLLSLLQSIAGWEVLNNNSLKQAISTLSTEGYQQFIYQHDQAKPMEMQGIMDALGQAFSAAGSIISAVAQQFGNAENTKATSLYKGQTSNLETYGKELNKALAAGSQVVTGATPAAAALARQGNIAAALGLNAAPAAADATALNDMIGGNFDYTSRTISDTEKGALVHMTNDQLVAAKNAYDDQLRTVSGLYQGASQQMTHFDTTTSLYTKLGTDTATSITTGLKSMYTKDAQIKQASSTLFGSMQQMANSINATLGKQAATFQDEIAQIAQQMQSLFR